MIQGHTLYLGELRATGMERIVDIFEALHSRAQNTVETTEVVDFALQITLTKDGRLILVADTEMRNGWKSTQITAYSAD